MGLLIYPLRHLKKTALVIGLSFLVVSTLCYVQFGNRPVWQAHFEQQLKVAQAEQVLKSFKNKTEVIQALKARLKHTHESARGWFLLGRLYASQGAWLEASQSFKEAYYLATEKQTFFVEYVIALWQSNHQRMTPKIRRLFQQILTKNPEQADALMFLAMDAYQNHHHKEAIRYWTRLLALVPMGSKDAEMIQQAIERARSDA